jgi:hypothetical protein
MLFKIFTMDSKDLNWSKTRVQCPYCDGWYTTQGIQGHIRFRHPDQTRDETKEAIKIMWTAAYVKAVEMYQRDGRLSAAMREQLLDYFLLEYLGRLAKGKT